jgi:hypothetical protein
MTENVKQSTAKTDAENSSRSQSTGGDVRKKHPPADHPHTKTPVPFYTAAHLRCRSWIFHKSSVAGMRKFITIVNLLIETNQLWQNKVSI